MNLKCIFTKNRPIDFSSLCSVVFTCIVHKDFFWVFFFFFPFFPPYLSLHISVPGRYSTVPGCNFKWDISGFGVPCCVYRRKSTEAHFGSAFCRLAQRSKSTGVQLLEGMSLSSSECWKLLRCPGSPWQRTWGPEYLGFPLRNSRICPESSDFSLQAVSLCQGAECCGCISPKTPRLKRCGLVFLLCVPPSGGGGRNCGNFERKTLFMQSSNLLSGNMASSILLIHNWGV